MIPANITFTKQQLIVFLHEFNRWLVVEQGGFAKHEDIEQWLAKWYEFKPMTGEPKKGKGKR